MKFLFAVLVVSVLVLLGTAVALCLRVRRRMRQSDQRLRQTLEEIENEQYTGHNY